MDAAGCIKITRSTRIYLFVRGRDEIKRGIGDIEERIRQSLFIVRIVCSPFNLQEINTGPC